MKLVWKLLRQHISIPQFLGFFLANLVGMVIIMLGVQVYNDVKSVYESEDSFMKADYLIVNKQISMMSALGGGGTTFTQDELDDFKSQPFVKNFGWFSASRYRVRATFDIQQFARFSTDMFFESVPDEFVDVKSEAWEYKEGQTQIPIILPRNYLDLYNFGYAQSRSLPKLSEGILGALKLGITIEGNGTAGEYTGRIVGFSSRLNTILVPQSFMDYANATFADGSEEDAGTSRVIAEVDNPTDDRIASYLEKNGWETDQDKLAQSKTAYMLKLITGIVMAIGLIISVLAIYILMLSVYLLVEKNSTKLENLLLIGYSPRRVALPYQMLTVGLNVLVLILAIATVMTVRHYYLEMLYNMFPDMDTPSMMPAMMVGVVLLIVVSLINIAAVYGKVKGIWRKKS